MSVTDEKIYAHGAVKSKNYEQISAFNPSYKQRGLGDITTPSHLDYRDNLRPIRDQGNQNTCVGQVGSCIKEYEQAVQNECKHHFSPQFIFNSRQDLKIDGMSGHELMEILLNKGVCYDHTFPYGSKETGHHIPDDAKEEAEKHKVKSYAAIHFKEGKNESNIYNLKSALVSNGPCYISLPIYNFSKTFWKPRHHDEKEDGGHAVTIVGYNDEGFILRNSWGDDWADNGYATYPYTDFQKGIHWELFTCVDEKRKYVYDRDLRRVSKCDCKCDCTLL